MKHPIFTLLFAACLAATTGCTTATSPARANAATTAAERGAPAALVSTLQRGERLSIADIEQLATFKIPDGMILAYLRDEGAAYALSTLQVIHLRDAGVSTQVIDYLLKTSARASNRYRGYYGGSMRRGRYYGSQYGYGSRGSSHRGGRH